MRIIRTSKRQLCVYWAPLGVDDFGNKFYASPVEVKCRWEDSSEMFLAPSGDEQVSRAIVDTEIDVALLGVLWLPPNNVRISTGAAITQLVSLTDPFLNPGAFEIRKFEKIPELRVKPNDANGILRTAWL